MKNKKIWIITVCILLVLLLVVLSTYKKNVPEIAEDTAAATDEKAGSVKDDAAKTAEDGKETIATAAESGSTENDSTDTSTVTIDNNEDPSAEEGTSNQTTGEESEGGDVIVIPDDMGIGGL